MPVMIGVTSDDGLGKIELEWTMFSESDVKSPEAYRALLEHRFGRERLAAALAQYPASTEVEVEAALGHISNDLWYNMGSWLMADLLSAVERPQPVYFYTVTEPAFTRHGKDTPLWNDSKWSDAGRPHSAAPHAARTFLANFAYTGDPNGTPGNGGGSEDGLPTWRPHQLEQPDYMELGPTTGMRSRSAEARERYVLVSEYIRGTAVASREV